MGAKSNALVTFNPAWTAVTHDRLASTSDEVSDNRHGQQGTPADMHGRSVAGHVCCGFSSSRPARTELANDRSV
jgi:hypothetical protein